MVRRKARTRPTASPMKPKPSWPATMPTNMELAASDLSRSLCAYTSAMDTIARLMFTML